MNALELKGGIIEMIAQVEDKKVLNELYKLVSEVLFQTWAAEGTLSPEQEAELDLAIKESRDPSNLVSHEEAMKKMGKWLDK